MRKEERIPDDDGPQRQAADTADTRAGMAAKPVALQLGMFWGASAGAGGLDRVYNGLVNHLPAAGIDTIGIVEGPAGVAEATLGRVRQYNQAGHGGARRVLGFRQAIAATMREEDVAVTALHFAFYGLPAVDLLKRKPLVMHFHGPWAGESGFERQAVLATAAKMWIERLVYCRADRVIVLSQAFADLVETFGVSPDRVRIVPGHVDLDRFRSPLSRIEARERLGLPTDRPLLVSVRRLKRRMGLEHLVEAMTDVARRNPDVLLCIAGTGTLHERLQELIVISGLERSVRMLGYVSDEDLPLLYRAADLNVVPTLALEGFGLVAAEALAAGTPSLVTPVGGLPEVVSDLSPALVLDSATVSAIGDRLNGFLDGTVKLPSIEACSTFAAERFSVSLAARRTAAVYSELLS